MLEASDALSYRSVRRDQERRGDPASPEKYADRFGRVAIDNDDAEYGDIHAKSARWFGDSDLLRRPEWRVSQAKLRIKFHPEGNGKRAKMINVELRAPNGSNLKDQTRRHQIISEKYLLCWGLIKNAMAAVA